MVKRRGRGYSLMEALVVMGLFFTVFLIIRHPLLIILQYPNKMVHHRTDRIAGQKVYNNFYLDLRNSKSEGVWSTRTASGDTLVLIVSVARYDNADSEGQPVYNLWKYSPAKKTLYRNDWSSSRMTQANLPAVTTEPTGAQWTKFEQAKVKAMAFHVQSFNFTSTPDEGSRLEYGIKNPRRDGKVDHYLLEADTL